MVKAVNSHPHPLVNSHPHPLNDILKTSELRDNKFKKLCSKHKKIIQSNAKDQISSSISKTFQAVTKYTTSFFRPTLFLPTPLNQEEQNEEIKRIKSIIETGEAPTEPSRIQTIVDATEDLINSDSNPLNEQFQKTKTNIEKFIRENSGNKELEQSPEPTTVEKKIKRLKAIQKVKNEQFEYVEQLANLSLERNRFLRKELKLITPANETLTTEMETCINEEKKSYLEKIYPFKRKVKKELASINVELNDLETSYIIEKSNDYLKYFSTHEDVLKTNDHSNEDFAQTLSEATGKNSTKLHELDISLQKYKQKLSELQSLNTPEGVQKYLESVGNLDNELETKTDFVEKKCKSLIVEIQSHYLKYQETKLEIDLLKYQDLKQKAKASKEDSPGNLSSFDQTKLALFFDQIKALGKEIKKEHLKLQALANLYGTSAENDFKGRLKTITDFAMNIFGGGSPAETITSNAHLLLLTVSDKMTFRTSNSLSFKNPIQELQKNKRQLKTEINENKELQNRDLKKELNEANRLIYHLYLEKIIKEIGVKQGILLRSQPSKAYQQILEIEVKKLNETFDKIIEKYKKLPEQDNVSLPQKWYSTFFGSAPLIGCLFTVEEFKRNRAFAKAGYDIVANLAEFAKPFQTKEFKVREFTKNLQTQIEEFIKWSDQDPESAITLASDLTLLASVCLDKSFVDSFKAQMRAKAYLYGFYGKPFNSREPSYSPEMMKYYALSKAARFAPVIASLMKEAPKVIERDFSYGSMMKSGYNIASTLVVQKSSDFVPNDYARYGLALSQILKGEDFAAILKEQRNVELASIAGDVKILLSDPKQFVKQIKFKAKVWLKTFSEAKHSEKIARIATQIIPIVGLVLLTVALVASGTILGLPILVSFSALTTSALLFSIPVAVKIESLFSLWWTTHNKVEKEMKEKLQKTEKEAAALKRQILEQKDEILEQIATRVEAQAYAFITSRENCFLSKNLSLLPKLSPEQKENLKDKIITTKEKYIRVLTDTAPDIQLIEANKEVVLVEHYDTTLASLMESINNDESISEELKTPFFHQVAEELKQEWLFPEVKKVFEYIVIDFYINKPPVAENIQARDPKEFIQKKLGEKIPNAEGKLEDIIPEDIQKELLKIAFPKQSKQF